MARGREPRSRAGLNDASIMREENQQSWPRRKQTLVAVAYKAGIEPHQLASCRIIFTPEAEGIGAQIKRACLDTGMAASASAMTIFGRHARVVKKYGRGG